MKPDKQRFRGEVGGILGSQRVEKIQIAQVLLLKMGQKVLILWSLSTLVILHIKGAGNDDDERLGPCLADLPVKSVKQGRYCLESVALQIGATIFEVNSELNT